MELFWAYPHDLNNVKDLDIVQLRKHAQVSTDNGCECFDKLPEKFSDLCFCCQCLVYLKYPVNIGLYNYDFDKKMDLYEFVHETAGKPV